MSRVRIITFFARHCLQYLSGMLRNCSSSVGKSVSSQIQELAPEQANTLCIIFQYRMRISAHASDICIQMYVFSRPFVTGFLPFASAAEAACFSASSAMRSFRLQPHTVPLSALPMKVPANRIQDSGHAILQRIQIHFGTPISAGMFIIRARIAVWELVEPCTVTNPRILSLSNCTVSLGVQIICHDNGRFHLLHIHSGAVSGQILNQTIGNISDIRSSCLHVIIVHCRQTSPQNCLRSLRRHMLH